MQVEGNWKSAANLNLLLGKTHPPTRIEKSLLNPNASNSSGGSSEEASVEARSTVSFHTTSYCDLQDLSSATNQHIIASYYRTQLKRVLLPAYGTSVKTETDGGRALGVKGERESSEEAVSAAGVTGGVIDTSACTFRALGILTQVYEPTAIGEELLVPWEFYVIQDIDDDECYNAALKTLTHERSLESFPLLNAGTMNVASGPEGTGRNAKDSGVTLDSEHGGAEFLLDDNASSSKRRLGDGVRVSLFTKLLSKFTGVYAGMALGIIGEPFQRSSNGTLTGVLVRHIVLPVRPVLPWRLDRPLRAASLSAAAAHGATRIHFCSGPFPRRDISSLLRMVTTQALNRGADLLIIGGPLIKPFDDFEKSLLSTLQTTFTENLESYFEVVEETLTAYYSTRKFLPHMKVILVPHRDDVTQIPVLPMTMYALAGTSDIMVSSNPCRIAINGVHIGVCNDDVVGWMRDRMVERWPTAEGSLRRVVETLVQSRFYTPIMSLPLTHVDVKHLWQLRMDYAPETNMPLLDENDATEGGKQDDSVAAARVAKRQKEKWEAPFFKDGGIAEESVKRELKRVKHEPEDTLEAATEMSSFIDAMTTDSNPGEVEYMPHIMFLPSTRPQFAVVTHRGVPDDRLRDVGGSSVVRDESSLDDTEAATGVLVVNPEVWSRRKSPKFELRVAEVTLANSELVVRRGASANNGVACGILHIFDGGS